jgi:hypothetical protein
MLIPSNTGKITDLESRLKIKEAFIAAASDEDAYTRISALDGLAILKDYDVIPIIKRLARYDVYQAGQHGGEEGLYIVRIAAKIALKQLRGN